MYIGMFIGRYVCMYIYMYVLTVPGMSSTPYCLARMSTASSSLTYTHIGSISINLSISKGNGTKTNLTIKQVKLPRMGECGS